MIDYLRILVARLRGLFENRRVDRELDDEIGTHLRLLTERYVRQGMSEAEAAWAARRQFGNVTLLKETNREMRGIRFIETLVQDLRYGVRMSVKNPGFTLVVTVTLALGIGANTAIFGLVDAALFRPLPVVKAPDRLLKLVRGDGQGPTLSYPDFRFLREQNEVLSGLAIYTTITQISFGNSARSEAVLGSLVSGNYFEVLGIKPVLGRAFLPEEEQTPGSHPVVVLSHSFWRSRFNSDPTLVGKTIVLNNRRFTVVGIAPAGFDGQSTPMKVSMWIPVMMIMAIPLPPLDSGVSNDPLNDRRYQIFEAIGRLKHGVSVAQAQVALETINRQLEEAGPISPERPSGPNADRALKLIQPRGIVFSHIREMAVTATRLLAATVITVLLIACANVANLLLARAAMRRKEVAVRLALGATRWRLIRQLLTESVLLALVGATAGLLFAYWINQLLRTFKPPFPSTFTFTLDLSLNFRTFGFTLLLAFVTSVIFGLIPALQSSKPDVVRALKDESGGVGSQMRRLNFRNALVITQVALSLALLISTGLFLRSLQFARGIDLGFKPDHVLEVSFDLQLQGYNEAKGREFYRQIVERLERLPGAQTACVTNILPLGFRAPRSPVVREGREIPPNERTFAGSFAVGPRYFEIIGTPLIRGRDFTAQDTINSPHVAIVSEKLARSLWPEIRDPGEALGRRLRAGDPNFMSDVVNSISYEVIGVAKDSKNTIFNPIDRDPQPTLYRSFAQNYFPYASVVVRASGDPRSLIPSVRREVSALDENLPAQDLQPLTKTVGLALWSTRTGAAVLSVFGLLGLALAGVGIYGVMSYSVARRTREIGLRMALGAEARDVIRLILKRGMGLTLIGTIIGLMLALAMTRLLASLLYGVRATDPATFAGVALFLISVALLACYLPARKATKIDPMTALRHE